MIIQSLGESYEYEHMAAASRMGRLGFEPLPFYWVFEEACSQAGIKVTFDFVQGEYLLTPANSGETLWKNAQNLRQDLALGEITNSTRAMTAESLWRCVMAVVATIIAFLNIAPSAQAKDLIITPNEKQPWMKNVKHAAKELNTCIH